MPRTLQAKAMVGSDHKLHIDVDAPADYPEGEVTLSVILPEPESRENVRLGDFLQSAPFDDDFKAERDKSLPREIDL